MIVIVARGEEELYKARDEIEAAGGKCFAYTATSPTWPTATGW